MLRDVEIGRLAVGMYVAELDRPWLDTPFALQGFFITDTAEIARLGEYCDFVRVDPRRFDARLGPQPVLPDDGMRIESVAQRKRAERERRLVDSVTYDDAVPVEREMPVARLALDDSRAAFAAAWQELAERRTMSVAKLAEAVHPLVESVIRNKDALVTLLRVQRVDPNVHEHCIALAIWAGLLGRQLGLPPEHVRTLALGCSLVDIGKIRITPDILERSEALEADEAAEYETHVEHSLDMLADAPEVPLIVHEIVRWHHERMDGSGYPDRLMSSAIPMFARIAGIVDTYDTLIGPRRSGEPLSSFEALCQLQDRCPDQFQPELVERFARAIGLFPNGCLVELSTGEVGVVYSQNTGQRLRPRVMTILGPDKRRLDKLVIVDLSAADASELRITRELPVGEYGLQSREYFL